MNTVIYNLKKGNKVIIALTLIMLLTVITTSYHNHKKKINESNLKNLLNNVYLKKTLSNIFNQLDPKYEKIEHLISKGDSLSNIFDQYYVDRNDLQLLKKDYFKKNKINNLKINDILEFTIDRSTQKIIELSYPISKTKKLYLVRNKNLDELQTRATSSL